MTIFGRRDQWAIEVQPLAGALEDPDPAAAATWCDIRIWAGGKNLTAHTRMDTLETLEALHWPAVFLARWLVHSWSGLWERAGWPLAGAVFDPEQSCFLLDAHLAELGDDVDDEQLERRDAFVESHTLLAAFGGGIAPHVYLMREGSRVYIVWKEPRHLKSSVRFLEPQGRFTVSTAEFLDAIAEFLKWCRDRVARCAQDLATEIDKWSFRLDSPEAAEAVLNGYLSPWGRPDSFGPVIDKERVLDLPEGWRSAGARLDPSRIPAAVVFRALTPVVRPSDVEALLGLLRSYPHQSNASAKLDELRSRLTFSLREMPHLQGYRLGMAVREVLGNRDAFLDVEALLQELGVGLYEENLSDARVDAATVWDDQHGPVIVINTLGLRNEPWARRMTLAHELCHLLIDRQDAAPLMVASTPWAPPELERRANAFAAELLLPKAGILRVAAQAIRSGWLDETVRNALMNEFMVGVTVCTHQIENRLQMFL